ncbi:hypothetical protein RUM44_011590 [Polyplax serrata]|uniref:3',5'-cyclic-AMP phosphodiesterase n=1 Tax=Polyplax serrata TaxID=468196 RepID=A0ABR1AQF9_POLSC
MLLDNRQFLLKKLGGGEANVFNSQGKQKVQCLIETSNVGVLVNELVEIEHSEVRPRMSISNTNALYIALSKCKDLVQVTDEAFNVQFVNKATENVLGFKSEDLKGKPISDIHQSSEYHNQMIHFLNRGKEWEGAVTCIRKGGEPITLLCRVVSSSLSSRHITNYIFIEEPQNDAGMTYKDQPPRGSLHSIRKGSYDVKSLASESGQSIRRQSLAKLNSLPIEAPITKIITLLYSAHEQSSGPVQQQLEKVLDILRSTELYSPQLKETRIRTEDPITADLITALLSQGTVASSTTRRSSNDSANIKSSASSRPSLPSINTPGQLSSVLEQSLDWEFDIFKLEELSNQRPLVWLGMNLLCHFNVQDTLGCDEKTLMNWLTVVEMHYLSSNSYHNSTHAADVMQASGYYLKREKLNELLDPLDIACVLIAACCHDIDHPGKSSIFLSNSDHDLAILYNDQSVLESHHAAMTFKLTLADDRVNIFKGLERDTYKVARQSIIDMILATEMTRHFEHLAKFVNIFTKPEPKDEPDGVPTETDSSDACNFQTQENIALAKRMLIKCADVSNPTRPLKLCVEWAKRIAEEYFAQVDATHVPEILELKEVYNLKVTLQFQTDEEKANGLPVVMPMFDRSTCSIPKSQLGFIDFIINDMMEAWDSFIELPEMLYYLRSNYQYWKEREEQGITGINELCPHNNRIELLRELDESKGD